MTGSDFNVPDAGPGPNRTERRKTTTLDKYATLWNDGIEQIKGINDRNVKKDEG